MVTLFGTEPAKPIARRWTDPGDAKKTRHQRKKPPGEARRMPNVDKSKPKFNPYRQPIAEPDESEFRHMHWSRLRARVREIMGTVGTATTALDRFDNCGAECLVEWSDEAKRYRLRASYCRCRHCKPCTKARTQLIAGNLRKKLQDGVQQDGMRFRFITLTLRHSRLPLVDQIKNLYRHFSVLRRSKLWKNSQVGGAVTFECKLNDAGEWHPHLHIISEGDFLKQDQLANHWMKITNGSFKVDIRRVKNAADAANYVSKYAAKGCDDSVWNVAAKAQEWVLATRGLRTCATFGTWRGFALLKHDPAEAVTDWKPVALLSRICAQARAGSLADERLLILLADALQYDPSRKRDRKPQRVEAS